MRTYPDPISKRGLKAIRNQLGYFVGGADVRATDAGNAPEGSPPATATRGLPPDSGTRGEEPTTTPPPNEIRCGESFSLYTLGTDGIRAYKQPEDGDGGGDPLADLAKNTGRWHHQIKFDGVAKAFARSVIDESEPKSSSVREFFSSPLAESIERAIKWIDRHVEDKLLVRLLTVPSYRIEAFWLSDEKTNQGRVLVIEAPPGFAELPLDRLISSQQFLEVLSNNIPSAGFG
ncbi:MAG TPA: hypothetical protein VNA19_02305 [Pyrinomonadaceae bacterium]|jgi:hypothetical protein|nr:hypothetical protein [Pyrinomonadaceae bacterium]